MNLNDFDLNLLIAFDALLEEQHVTRAARRIGLSQPAMSNALGRLRAGLGDPILVRTGSGMTPTPRALELMGPIKEALATLEDALGRPPFSPDESEVNLSLAIDAQARHVLMPALVHLLSERAPAYSLTLHEAREYDALDTALREGAVDLAIVASEEDAKTSLEREVIATLPQVALMNTSHPLATRSKLAPDDLQAYPRIDLAGATTSSLDHLGAAALLSRSESHWLETSAQTATLMSVGRPLASIPLGVKSSRALVMMWHQRVEHDAAQRWLREQILEIDRLASDPARE